MKAIPVPPQLYIGHGAFSRPKPDKQLAKEVQQYELELEAVRLVIADEANEIAREGNRLYEARTDVIKNNTQAMMKDARKW